MPESIDYVSRVNELANRINTKIMDSSEYRNYQLLTTKARRGDEEALRNLEYMPEFFPKRK